MTWVDFRGGLDDEDAFHRLVAGIRGMAPGSGKIQIPGSPVVSPTGVKTPLTAEDYGIIEEQTSLKHQLAQHHRNLNKLREQAAIYAVGETPLHLLNKIEAEEAKIHVIEERLSELEDEANN
jgi:hypothetical protein